jgi:hypothetical protein
MKAFSSKVWLEETPAFGCEVADVLLAVGRIIKDRVTTGLLVDGGADAAVEVDGCAGDGDGDVNCGDEAPLRSPSRPATLSLKRRRGGWPGAPLILGYPRSDFEISSTSKGLILASIWQTNSSPIKEC